MRKGKHLTVFKTYSERELCDLIKEGICFLKAGKPQNALAHFDEALHINADNRNRSLIYYAKALALLYMGQFAEAERALCFTLSMRPEYKGAHALLEKIRKAGAPYVWLTELEKQEIEALTRRYNTWLLENGYPDTIISESKEDHVPPDNHRMSGAGELSETCKFLQRRLPFTSYQIFEEFDLLNGHPWSETAQSDETTYYACLYGIVRQEGPRKILEIGTAFGMSAATLLKACPEVDLFLSLDLGIYSEQLGASINNIDFARTRIHTWCRRKGIALSRVRFYQANTQPLGKGDNDNMGKDIQRWYQIPELV